LNVKTEVLEERYLNYKALEETKLFEMLDQLDRGLSAKVRAIASQAARILAGVVQHMPFYTLQRPPYLSGPCGSGCRSGDGIDPCAA
jgi:hypothetical protein